MQIDITPQDVLEFWLEEIGPKGWYDGSRELDEIVRHRFGAAWATVKEADIAPWLDTPGGSLASLILLDQFPRNMFRDLPDAFATDSLARRTARIAIAADHPQAIASPAKQFFFMPFCHSEILSEQDEGISLLEAALPGSDTLLHARAHREVIALYGRFPFRNKALSRASSDEEGAFMREGGYPALVQRLKAKGAA